MATDFEASVEARLLDAAFTRADREGVGLSDEAREYLGSEVRNFAITHANNLFKLRPLNDLELQDRYADAGLEFARASLESVIAFSATTARSQAFPSIVLDTIRAALRSLCPWWPFC